MITVEKLTKTYGKGESRVEALRQVSFTVPDGEFTAIIGKSGSGKTTLLNLLGGLDTGDSGSIRYGEQELMGLGDTALAEFRLRHIGFVFQFYDLLPELTAEENILLPARLAKHKPAEFEKITQRLGIVDRLKHYPAQLSGGQQQRVAIARALINNPKVLLCDEPTGNLDEKSGKEVMALLHELNQQDHRTVLLVTHDPELAAACDRTIVISDGSLVS